MLHSIMQGRKGKGSSREVKPKKSWAATHHLISQLKFWIHVQAHSWSWGMWKKTFLGKKKIALSDRDELQFSPPVFGLDNREEAEFLTFSADNLYTGKQQSFYRSLMLVTSITGKVRSQIGWH